MSADGSPIREADVTIPYTSSDELVAAEIPHYEATGMRNLGWGAQAPGLGAMADTVNSALQDTVPAISQAIQDNVLRTLHHEQDMAPPPAFDMVSFIAALRYDNNAMTVLRNLVAPPRAPPASTELHALMDRAASGLAAYLLFLKEAKDLKLSLIDRAALFSKTLSLIEHAARRTQLSELQVYHAQLAAAYTDPVALACLNEPSVTHAHKSVTAVEVLTWIKAYKDARPRTKAPKNAGGGHPGRRTLPRKTGTVPQGQPADKPKSATSSVKKPNAGK